MATGPRKFETNDPTWKKKQSSDYGRRHKALAKQVLATGNPCACQGCPECQTADGSRCMRPPTDADHIIPHRGDPRLRDDPANYQPMCEPCHIEKTKRGQ